MSDWQAAGRDSRLRLSSVGPFHGKQLIPHQYSPSVASQDGAPLRLVVPAARGGERIDQALAALMPEHSRSRLQQWIRGGRVRVDGRPVRSADRIWGGELLEVTPGTDPQQ
ncbi:MAG: hypothetical protein K2W80_13495, partial [Burkholderiales bacterium]|nr:hypothetical protein [Burkholderiales bacterium]